MAKKLNSYILEDDIIRRMKRMIQETKDDGLERQFDFCADRKSNILLGRNRCIGKTCSVTSRKICKFGEDLVGSFHTHPIPFSEKPSSADIFNMMNEGLGCVGSATTNQIKCLIFKDGEQRKNYPYMKNVYNDIIKLENIEREITEGAEERPYLWPKISKQLDSLKVKNEIIDKYFSTQNL